MEEENYDVVFIIEEFLENLGSTKEEHIEASEDEVEAEKEDVEEIRDEFDEANSYIKKEDYQQQRFV